MMTVDQLYPQLTDAILRAETLDDLGAPGTRAAYLEVSLLEEKVAGLLAASSSQGALARRGAVRAALSARDLPRAQKLAARFLAEAGLSDGSRAEIRRMVGEAEGAATARFPRISALFDFDIKGLGRVFGQQPAPFPVG